MINEIINLLSYKYLNVEFVADRITDIKGPDEFNIFMDLYYMANRVIYGDDCPHSKKPADDEEPSTGKEAEAPADGDRPTASPLIRTKCLVCGEDIISTDENVSPFVSPYVRICKHCGANLDGKASKKVAKAAKAEKKVEVAEEKPAEKKTTAKKSTSTTTKKAPAKKSATKTAQPKTITRDGGDK